MVNKSFYTLLNTLYEKNMITNYNDPYFFKKYMTNKTLTDIIPVLDTIYNHKCLNLIKNNGIDHIESIKLFYQHCITNNVTNPANIHRLAKWNNNVLYYVTYEKMLNDIFKNKAYDILIILSMHNYIHYYWLDKNKHEKDINIIIEEIEVLVKYNIMTFNDIFLRVYRTYDYDLLLKKEVMCYLEKCIGSKVVSYMLAKFT
jgi:hypothetical protein